MSIRSIIFLAAALCAAPLTAATAQQIADATRTASAPASETTEAAAPSGPRVAAPIQRVEPTLASSRAPRSVYLYKENHTIVLSTLALVLAVVLIVVLIIR